MYSDDYGDEALMCRECCWPIEDPEPGENCWLVDYDDGSAVCEDCHGD